MDWSSSPTQQMFLGGDCGEGDVIPGCAESADPESRGDCPSSPDSGFIASRCPGMTEESARSGMTGASTAPGMTEERGAPGFEGACDSRRSHRYCATLVS